MSYAVAWERSLGERSPFFGYLQTLPLFEPLPLTWAPIELRWLAGTGIDADARRRYSEAAREHREIVAALRASPDHRALADAVDLRSYLHATTLTSSRAFYVDASHGEALVPFADLLNHKCALVPEGAIVEGGVANAAAAVAASSWDPDDDRVASVRRRRAAERAAAAAGLDLRPDTTLHNLGDGGDGDDGGGGSGGSDADSDDADSDDDGGAAAVALVALRPLACSREVCNTYGELSNGALLSAYGFTLPRNPLDVATLPWALVRSAACAILGARGVRARERSLRAAACGPCYAALCTEREHAFDVEGTPPPELLLGLWMLLAAPPTAPEWMATAAAADDDDGVKAAAAGAAARRVAAAAAAFISAPLEAQLTPPSPVRTSLSQVLAAAIARHVTTYTPPAGVRADASESSRAAHALSVSVVEGERRIWRRAQQRLLGQ